MRLAAFAPFVDRLQAVLRTREWIADVAMAALVGVIGAVSKPTISFATGPQTAYSLIVLGCSAAMLIRRSRPQVALAIMALLLVAHLLLVDEMSVFAGAICLIAAYTTQTRLTPPWRWLFLAATYAGATIATFTASEPGLGTDWRPRAIATAAVSAVLTVAALIGVVRRNARIRYDLATERAAVLEAQQDMERRLAAVAERNRIASEMHDILGHSLNVIAVQAEGARYALRNDPDRADQALSDIGHLSRSAVDEVRDLIDVLHTGDEAADTRPTPSLREVPDLIGTFQHIGTTIRLRIDGDPETIPSQVGLAAYRIIQESLTNAITHAGRAPIMVRVTIGTRSIDLLIANGAPVPTGQPHTARHGHGLTGIRERVHTLGGTVDVGPDPTTGGWRVTSHLPWSRE